LTRRLLVTTGLEQTWGDGEPILYTGEWCRLYDRRDAWSSRQHEVLAYHWSDRAKLMRDHKYLNDLQESLLVFLAEALNVYHNIERPVRYWRMVLGVWLPTYVAVLFDRWECLRLAFGREGPMDTIALPLPERNDPLCDSDAFINWAAYSPEWNHRLSLQIIRYAHAERCSIRSIAVAAAARQQPAFEPPGAFVTRRSVAKSALRALVWGSDAVAGLLFSSYKVTLVNSYFPPLALVKLNLALRQLPRLHNKEFAYRAGTVNACSPARAGRDSSLRISRVATCDFEAFLTREIAWNIPRAYLEDFAALLDRVRRIRIKTKVICSAGAHWGNELFKLWCAEQVLKGSKFVALAHGGAIPALIDQTMRFEEKIADKKATWSIPYLPNHVRLPPNKLASRRSHSSKALHSSKTICSVITQETPLYPFRASDGPIGIGVLEIVPLVCNLFAGLRPEIQRCFRVKPYRNVGWNTRQRFSDAIGADKILAEPSYKRCLAQSRVVICTYPETTFAEAMASGLPTLLVYSAHLWGAIPQMESLLATLRSAGVMYDDAHRAADHLNRIWYDADGWWSSPAVATAREQFFASCLDLDERWCKKWAGFLRELAA
jgi:putative transferase (TIGR04331 family)